jgi:mono/diheme cytochrome c family protein
MASGFRLQASGVLGLVALVMMSVVSAQTPAPAPAAQAAGNAENGKRLFMKETCYYCHGTVGQGAGVVGARIGPPTRALAGFIRYVRRPSGQMPAITEKVVSDQELTDIYAFLRTIPASKGSKDIPILSELKKP